MQFETPQLLGDSLQPRGAEPFYCKFQSPAALEMQATTVRGCPMKSLLLRSLIRLGQTGKGSSAPTCVTALTGAWNGRAWEQNLIDSFPRYPPGFCYHTHLVLIYPLQELNFSSFASLFGVCMQSHLRLAVYHKPASRAMDWRAVISLEMLPEYSATESEFLFTSELKLRINLLQS